MDSVNSRGSWPKASDFPEPDVKRDSMVDKGIIILQLVRKYKSDNNLSIAHPLEEVLYTGVELDESFMGDLRSAVKAKKMVAVDQLPIGALYNEDETVGIKVL